MHILIELFICLLMGFIWWAVLLPVVILASTPAILISALFRKGSYMASVRSMYATVIRFWVKWGPAVVP